MSLLENLLIIEGGKNKPGRNGDIQNDTGIPWTQHGRKIKCKSK